VLLQSCRKKKKNLFFQVLKQRSPTSRDPERKNATSLKAKNACPSKRWEWSKFKSVFLETWDAACFWFWRAEICSSRRMALSIASGVMSW